MKLKALGTDVDATAAAAGTAVKCDATPFLPGRTAILVAQTNALAGAGATVKVQSSPDGTTWTDVKSLTADGPVFGEEVTLVEQMRINVTTAGSAGTVSAYLIGGV